MKISCLLFALVLNSCFLYAQSIEVKQSDKIKTDNNTPNKANSGDVIQYKVNIQNTGGANATGVQLKAVPDTKTTFVNGSFVSTSIAVNDAYTCTGNVGINVPAASGVLINDFDDNLGGATLTCNACNPTANDGTVTLNNDGSFTYIPAAGFTGMDQFTYTINDATIPDGATPIAGDITATVTITISNMIWFIDNSSVAALSDGRRSSPFKTLASFELVNGTGGLNPAAGHTIYIEHTGTNYSGGVSLENNQIVIGEGHTGTSTMIANENLSVALSFALAPFSLALPNIDGSRPIVTNAGGDGLTLAANNNLRGFDLGNCSDFGIDDNGNVGTLTINEVSINNTTGGGFRADNGGTLAVTMGALSSTGGANGVNLNNVGGNFTVTNTTSITNSTSAAVTIANNSSTVNFNALNITNTTSNQTGIFASGGTINSSSGTINTGSGRAVDMDNAALSMMLTAVSCNGCTTGIDLNTTTGSFAVNGTGMASSGGTIQNVANRGASFISATNVNLSYMNFTNANTTDNADPEPAVSLGNNTTVNAAIHLNNVTNIMLDNLVINGAVQQGINGHTVTGFTLSNSALSNLGNGADEDGLHFYNMLGTCAIINTTISSSGDDNVNIQNASGTSNITITGGSFNTGILGSGLLFGPRLTSNTTINISGVVCDNNFSGGIVADASNDADMVINISSSTITNNNDGIAISGASGDVQFDINNNIAFTGQDFANINILKAAFSTGGVLEGKIRNNSNINTANGRPADAISVFNAGGGQLKFIIANNVINYAGTQRAILVQGGQDGAAAVEGTITGNTIDIQLDGIGNAVAGILAQAIVATPSGNGTTMCIDVGGAGAFRNIFTHSIGGVIAGGDIRVRQRNGGPVRLPGYGGAGNDDTAVINYLTGRNTVISSPTATNDNGLFSGGSACLLPLN